jgi:hypothetical protein
MNATQAKLKQYTPHLIAVALFLVISAIYFSPVLKGLSLPQSDMTQAAGASKELKDYKQASGNSAFWANNMFSGMPSYQILGPNGGNKLPQLSSPLVLGDTYSLNMGIVFLYMIGFYVALIAFGTTPWIAVLGAIGFALGSYNIIIIEVGHITKAWALSMMAPILAGMFLAFRKRYVQGVALFIVALALQLNFNHIQITYYTMLAGVILAISYFVYDIIKKDLKTYFIAVGLLLAGCVVSLMPTSAQLMLNQEYVSHTMRGGSELTVKPKNEANNVNNKGLSQNYAFQWSYGKGETLTLLIPDARGGGGADQRFESNAKNRIAAVQSTQPAFAQNGNVPETQANQVINQYVASSYWGEQTFTASTVYFGAVLCFLALLGFIIVKGPEKWWLLVATILSIILAWGSNCIGINSWFFEHLPLYSKFRTPSMALVIANAMMVIVACLGLKAFFIQKEENTHKAISRQKGLIISAAITGGVCLLCAIMPEAWATFSSSHDKQIADLMGTAFIQPWFDDRKAMWVADSWRSFIFIAFAFVVMFLYQKDKLVKKPFIVVIMLTMLVIIDLWGVDKRYLSSDSFKSAQETQIVPTQADDQITAEVTSKGINHYRVYNLAANTFNESATSYFHPSIGGYHAAKLQRYQDIIDFYFTNNSYVQKDLDNQTLLSTNPTRQLLYSAKGQISLNLGVLNMLDTKYLIIPSQGSTQVVPNTEACGAAWFVPTIKWVNTPDEEIQALDNFNPRQIAVVNKSTFGSVAKACPSFDSSATIKFERSADRSPDYLKYTTSSKCEQVMVCSEIYFAESWRCYIDGKKTPYFRANYVLRAVNVPAGNHTVEWKINSSIYNKFNPISWIGTILVVLIALFAIVYPFIKKDKENKTQENKNRFAYTSNEDIIIIKKGNNTSKRPSNKTKK